MAGVRIVTDSAADLIWPIAWARVTGQRMDYWTFSRMAIATQLGHFRPAVEQQVATIHGDLTQAMTNSVHRIAIELINPAESDTIASDRAARRAWLKQRGYRVIEQARVSNLGNCRVLLQ